MKSPQTSLEKNHFPVMLKEVIDICSPKNGGSFLDCTFGGGGYVNELLKFPKTNLIAIDRDTNVIETADNLKKKFKNRFNFHNIKFSDIDSVIDRSLDAIIFDLGISSIQLDDMTRGFSFKSNCELNMSMGLSPFSAKEVVNNYSYETLKKIIKIFGEDKDAAKIAKNIILERNKSLIIKTDRLVDIIKKSKKKDFKRKIDISTKTFQAIRIFVNKEISELVEGMIKATELLKPGGKLIFLSFHSIEDKIIKFYFKNFSSNRSRQNKYIPEINNTKLSLFEPYRNKVHKASIKEMALNPRSRSAKLRYAVRNENKFNDPEELRNKFKKYIDLEKEND
tara:strand:- start:199 stop:1209 length:1011 start_codon:yes stop_codon:yes gene_type:complete